MISNGLGQVVGQRVVFSSLNRLETIGFNSQFLDLSMTNQTNPQFFKKTMA
jgi:hypothetical protein